MRSVNSQRRCELMLSIHQLELGFRTNKRLELPLAAQRFCGHKKVPLIGNRSDDSSRVP
jgi:hypothetical protein